MCWHRSSMSLDVGKTRQLVNSVSKLYEKMIDVSTGYSKQRVYHQVSSSSPRAPWQASPFLRLHSDGH